MRQEQRSKVTQEKTDEIRHGNTLTLRQGYKQLQEQSHEEETMQEKENIVQVLLKPERSDNYLPNQLLQKKRKKKQFKGVHL